MYAFVYVKFVFVRDTCVKEYKSQEEKSKYENERATVGDTFSHANYVLCLKARKETMEKNTLFYRLKGLPQESIF